LKENVIVGRLIPAGTGLAYHRNRRMKSAGQSAAEGIFDLPKTEENEVEGTQAVDAA